MFKKIVSAMLGMVITLSATVCLAANPIRVELDYVPIAFDQEPLIVNDRTMVPVRAIFEAMGASVVWDDDTKTVHSKLDDITVAMTIDEPVITVSGTAKTIDTAPIIRGDRTLVPVRGVSESFGCSVEWDENNRLVSIFSQDFQKRAKKAVSFDSKKHLQNDKTSADVAFGISYFPEYEIKTDIADGTDFEILSTTENGHVSINVRTDLFTGADEPITDAYAKSIGEGIAAVLSGKLISTGITKLGETDFIRIVYTAPGTAYDVTDQEPESTIYIARKNGVVYTMTYMVYGAVSSNILSDFGYMVHSMEIVSSHP